MNLQEILKETYSYDNNVLIAEFDNGFSIAYEKGQERWIQVDEQGNPKGRFREGESFVKYGLLPQGNSLRHGHNAQFLENGQSTGFSQSTEVILRNYLSQGEIAFGEQNNRQNVQQELYRKMIEPLGVEEYTCRDWDGIKISFAMGLAGWPMLLYSMITRKALSASGDTELACLYGPFLLGIGIKELLIPSQKAKRVTDTEALSTERTEGFAAVYLNHSNNAKSFNYLELIFPNGITLGSYGIGNASRPSNQKYVLERYNNARYFLSIDKILRSELYASVEQEERKTTEWNNFQPTKEEHAVFLKQVGFL